MEEADIDAVPRSQTRPSRRLEQDGEEPGTSRGRFGGRRRSRNGLLRRFSWRSASKLKQNLIQAWALEEEFGHVFLLYPVFMGAGAAWWFSLDTGIPPFRIYAWVALLGVCTWLTRFSSCGRRHPIRFALFFIAGMASASFQTSMTDTVIIDGPVTTMVSGRIREAEAVGPEQWRYVVDVMRTTGPRLRRPPSAVLLTVRSKHPVFSPGTVIRARAHLQPPAGPALPGLNDFAFSSYFRRIGAIGFVFGTPVEVPETQSSSDPWADRMRRWISALRSEISRRVMTELPGDPGAFAAAIITNDRRALSKSTLDALRASGLAHVIAISGLHMALASGLFFYGLRYAFSLFPALIQRFPAKKLAAAGALAAGGAYYLISGGPVSAERAYIMLCIVLGAVLIDRPAFSLRNVAVAAFMVLFAAPSSVMGPSFQMSFAAATALISAYTLWHLRPPGMKPLLLFPVIAYLAPLTRLAGGILLTSAIGGLSTAVFAAAHFQQVASYGLAANLLAMPIFSFVVVPFGMAAVLLMPLGLDSLPLLIMGKGLEVTIAIARIVSSWGGNLSTGQLAGWVLPTVSAAFVVATLFKSRLRIAGAGVFIILVGIASACGRVSKPDLLISEDGTLVAFTENQALAPNRTRPAAFIFDQWRRALDARAVVAPAIQKSVLAPRLYGTALSDADVWKTENAMEATAKAISPDRFTCYGRDWCLGKLSNGMIVITYRDPAFRGPACRQADIAIAATRLTRTACKPYEARQIDATQLRKRGAIAAYLREGSRNVVFKGAMDGADRPWNQHRYYDWRTGVFSHPFSVSNDSAG